MLRENIRNDQAKRNRCQNIRQYAADVIPQQRKKLSLFAEFKIENKEDEIAEDCQKGEGDRAKDDAPAKYPSGCRAGDERIDRAADANRDEYICNIEEFFERRSNPGGIVTMRLRILQERKHRRNREEHDGQRNPTRHHAGQHGDEADLHRLVRGDIDRHHMAQDHNHKHDDAVENIAHGGLRV